MLPEDSSQSEHSDTQSPVNIASGTEVSHYRILQPIGTGGMGQVYLALDLSLNRRVAIKFITSHRGSAAASDDPLPEAHIAAVQDHPAPVKVHEVGRFRDTPFIVMEYIEGTSLSQLLEGAARLEAVRAVDIAMQLCSGLAATHEHGVMHGDIKPANIMIDRHGRVRILDFGVARAFSRFDDDTPVDQSGTIRYMAPERLHGGEAKAQSDLFSVGVLLYRMLAGRLPFDGRYDAEVIYAITNKNPDPLRETAPKIPAELEEIVHRLLDKDPRKRFTSAVEVTRALGALSISAGRNWPGSRGARAAVAGGLVLAALSAATWFAWSDRSKDVAPASSVPTIAVLPFENLGAPGDEYFSDGVTDAVTLALARAGNCRVISRHSSMLYKNTTKSLPQVARELGVDFLVTGSIHWRRAASDSIRVTLALLEPATDAYVWTSAYADRMDGIFAMQADMARDVARALTPDTADSQVPDIAAQPTANLEAYDFFLRGNEYFNRSWERADIEAAQQLYSRAVLADSTFALAWAMLARAEASLYWERYDPSEQRRESAFRAARLALALAPDLVEAHMALGYCYYHGERDYTRALEQFESGLAVDSNHSDLWNAVAAVHRRQGRIEQSLADFEHSLRLDPRSPLKAFDVGLTLGMLRRYKEAEDYLERTTLLAPDYSLAWIYRTWLPILDSGDTAAASRILSAALRVTDLSRSKYYWTLCRILHVPDSLLTAPRSAGGDLVSYYLYRARSARTRMDAREERLYSDSARLLLEERVRAYPRDAYAQSELGIALAGVGDSSGALVHGRQALTLLPDSREAFDAPFLILNMAEIFVMQGAQDQAVELLYSLFEIPGFASRDYLKLDFVWAPLAGHPRFRALIQAPQDSSEADRP